MIPVSEARQFVLAACDVLTPRRVALSDASGLVLAEAIRSTEAVPPFANSSMDGTFRAIRIAAKAPGNPTVRTRSGYYATPDAKTNK